MELGAQFWNASIEEMVKGYKKDPHTGLCLCLLCGKVYEGGEIFKVEDRFFTAEKMMVHHVDEDHGGMFDNLIDLNKKFTGLSDNQREMLQHIHKGESDTQISRQLGLTGSTIRNYRFKFREKERQAKTFLAIMGALHTSPAKEDIQDPTVEVVEPHRTATTLDERFHITQKDRDTVLSRFIDDTGKLLHFPKKEKRKVIILMELIKHFKREREYSEKEINRILGRVYQDYVTLRRYLIEYGFLDRSRDGSKYWVKEQ